MKKVLALIESFNIQTASGRNAVYLAGLQGLVSVTL